MSEHDTSYTVYVAADACPCKKPSEETSDEEYAAWVDNHPEGEGIGDCVTICMLTVDGVYCQECSHDQGEWVDHITYCDECEYPSDACQCGDAE